MRQSNRRPPTALELAWGIQPAPRRGPKPGLSLEEIIGAAVALADDEGIEALSMQRLAATLGFTTMALYRYVASKEDLVALAVDAAGGEAPELPMPEEGWRRGLERWAQAQDQLFRRHRWMVRVPITSAPMGPNQVGWMEAFLRCLAGTDLAAAERIGVLNLVSGFIHHHRRLYDDLERGAAAEGLTVEEAGVRYGQLLSGVLDPEKHAEVRAAFVGSAADGEPEEADVTDFEFGLARILDGVAHLLERRADQAAG